MSIANPLHTGFQCSAVFVDSICYLCFMLVFIMLSFMFLVAACWDGLASWLSCVWVFLCVFVAYSCGVPIRVWSLI